MLKGLVFDLQTFTSEAFALFIDKFLNGRCGVARGCNLSNTNNSVTIGDGYFVIRGRFLKIISGETISSITNNGYYSLVCEIDLSKTNTADQFNQGEIKTVFNASTYPTLTQQDITAAGTVYQYEFARFKVEGGNITNFTDRRTFVDFTSIYDIIQSEAQEVLDDIEEALQQVLDESIYILKDLTSLENTDIDDIQTTGFYTCNNTCSNLPVNALGNLCVYKRSANYVSQIYHALGSNLYYFRALAVGTWTDWAQVMDARKISRGTAIPSGGSDGDIYDQYFN